MRPNTKYIQTRKGGGRREGKVKRGKERRKGKKKGKEEGKKKEKKKEKERRRRKKGGKSENGGRRKRRRGKEGRKGGRRREREGKNGPEETQANGSEKGKTKCHSDLGTDEAVRYCEFSVTAVSVIDGVLLQRN